MQKILIRILDIVLSVAGIVLLSPVMLGIYLVGLVLNRSPLFFQQRVGRGRKPFTLVKFRTMAKDTASVGTHMVHSSSVTPFGRFLRRTKLDELPQLFNVLLGSMSLVGPRPCLPNQTTLVEERDRRGVYAIAPGITGIAQVNSIDMSTPRKLARYDQVTTHRLDLCLYFWLILVTATGRGRGDRVNNGEPGSAS